MRKVKSSPDDTAEGKFEQTHCAGRCCGHKGRRARCRLLSRTHRSRKRPSYGSAGSKIEASAQMKRPLIKSMFHDCLPAWNGGSLIEFGWCRRSWAWSWWSTALYRWALGPEISATRSKWCCCAPLDRKWSRLEDTERVYLRKVKEAVSWQLLTDTTSAKTQRAGPPRCATFNGKWTRNIREFISWLVKRFLMLHNTLNPTLVNIHAHSDPPSVIW